MNYTIGLDVGITSIGYSILRLDDNNNPDKIIFLNSFMFPIAENSKGESLANERGMLRRTRRINRRKKFRKHRVKSLFVKYGILGKKDLINIYQDLSTKSVYQLRVDGLDKKLTPKELFYVLYWFAGHRGFKSNRKSELKKKDIGKLLTSLEDTSNEIKDNGYRTAGELYLKSPKFKLHKRNKFYDEGYIGATYRSLVIDEVTKILKNQLELGNAFVNDDFKKEYLSILQSQRDFDEGPGSNSPYAGNQIEKMIGPDSLDRSRQRASKATYTFNYFNLLCKVNNLKYRSSIGDDFQPLSFEQKRFVVQKCLNNIKTSYKQVKKYIGLSNDDELNLVDYNAGKNSESRSKISDFSSVIDITNCLPDNLKDNVDLIDKIATILSMYKGDNSRTKELKKLKINIDDYIPELLYLNFSQFGKLSLETMKDIIKFLEKNQTYDDAAKSAGYDFKKVIIDKNYLENNVTNPVVKRAVSKSIKIVNKIIRKYGKPYSIHIELARDLGKSKMERNQITKMQNNNKARNEKIANRIKELGFKVDGQNILKYKLYEEQKGIDFYSKNSHPISIEAALKNNDLYEIDHIIPYSISFDDSYNNKILVSTQANRQKGNRIPMEYLKYDDEGANWLYLNAQKLSNKYKKERLLKKNLSDDDKSSWKERNIQDTRYINKLLSNYLKQNIDFAEQSNSTKVICLNGSVTAKIRSRWGISKYRNEGDLHHAVDSVVIACVNNSFVQKVTDYSKNDELKYNKDLWTPEFANNIDKYKTEKQFNKFFNDFPLPWEHFREELFGRISEDPTNYMKGKKWKNYNEQEIDNLHAPFVTRMPIKKISGPIHKDTIKSPKYIDQGIIQERALISKLKLKDNDRIFAGKYEYRVNDDGGNSYVWNKIFTSLVHKNELIKEYKNADEEDKPTIKEKINGIFRNGTFEYVQNGKKHVVRKVKVQQKRGNGVLLNNNTEFADNAKGSIIRIDVFVHDGKHVFVPIYRGDITKNKLPDTMAGKNKAEISVKDPFMFSLYPYDVLHVVLKRPKKIAYSRNGQQIERKISDFYGYYKSADITNSRISLVSNDNAFSFRVVLGALKLMEKCSIDYFGNISVVHERKRKKFN